MVCTLAVSTGLMCHPEEKEKQMKYGYWGGIDRRKIRTQIYRIRKLKQKKTGKMKSEKGLWQFKNVNIEYFQKI